MDSFLITIGFSRCHSDPNVYTKKVGSHLVILVLYVDDLIHYSSGGTPLLVGFTDSDWAGDPDDRKSTVGYVFSLGSGPVTWACKKQQAIVLYSVEEEYRAAVNASQEALWLRQILLEFGFHHHHSTSLWCDNQSSIKLAKDQFNISVANTSSYTCTSSESSFMIKLLKFSFSLQKIKLQTFSQSLLQK
jgi:hypothetical protein